jgi:hypothetical protein
LQLARVWAQPFVYAAIIMEAMRDTCTDDRMDDLAARMDRGFAQAAARMDRFENRIEARFDKIDDRFDKVDARFEKVDDRFEKVDDRFERVDARFEKSDERFEKLNERFEWQWRLLLATYLTTLVGLFTAHF